MASYIIEIRRPNTVGPLGGNAIATYRFDCKADREALAMLRVSKQPLLRKMRPGDVVVMHSARHQYDI